MKKNKSKNNWSSVGKIYQKLIIPNRPSQNDCLNYGLLVKKALAGIKKPKIMVMGSTPELRGILYTCELLNNAEVFCLDAAESMYGAMTDFLSRAESYNEKYLKRSWLDTKLKDKTFDLVVGDEVICNVNKKLHSELFGEISRILKDNGAWITRHNFYTDEIKKLDARKILIDLAEKIDRGEYSFQLAVNVLLALFFYLDGWKNPMNNSMDLHLEEMKEELKNYFAKHKRKKIAKELVNFYRDNFQKIMKGYKWYLLSEKESEEELKKFFVIKEKLFSSDYPTVRYSPIYLLNKKK